MFGAVKRFGLFARESLVRAAQVHRRAFAGTIKLPRDVLPTVGFSTATTTTSSLAVALVAHVMNADDCKGEAAFRRELARADELFLNDEYEQVAQLLQRYNDERNEHYDRVQWRLCRALYFIGARDPSDGKNVELFNALRKSLHRALTVDPGAPEVHTWTAIVKYMEMRDSQILTGREFTMAETSRCMNTMKSHLLRALELESEDPFTFMTIGTLCILCLTVTNYQRLRYKITQDLDFPRSTYAEALHYLKKGASSDKRKTDVRLLFVYGILHVHMDQTFTAKQYLLLASKHTAKNSSEQEYVDSAKEVLKYF